MVSAALIRKNGHLITQNIDCERINLTNIIVNLHNRVSSDPCCAWPQWKKDNQTLPDYWRIAVYSVAHQLYSWISITALFTQEESI